MMPGQDDHTIFAPPAANCVADGGGVCRSTSPPNKPSITAASVAGAVATHSILRHEIDRECNSKTSRNHQRKEQTKDNTILPLEDSDFVFDKEAITEKVQQEGAGVPDSTRADTDGKVWLDGPTPVLSRYTTSESSSSSSECSTGPLIECEDLATMIKMDGPGMLVVDVRPSAEYVESHVKSAVSICFPTTLLKRPNFTVSKLLQSLGVHKSKGEIDRLRDTNRVVIYDSTSTDTSIKPYSTVVLTKNKFSKDPDVPGEVSCLNGGFEKFQAKFPELVDKNSDSGDYSQENKSTKKKKIAKSDNVPYIGASTMEPFYHNIRQNTDMIDLAQASGIERMMANKENILRAVKFKYDEDILKEKLPGWLYFAISEEGAWYLGQRFYSIERAEQKRMRKAMMRLMQPKPVSPDGISITNAVIQSNRNRYHNVYSFDQTRVRLDMGMMESSCDYINANYLSIPGSKRKYIACQAPLKNTAKDFWGMVWQEGIQTIAMLSAVEEAGAKKCDVYWDEGEYGPFVLKIFGQRSIALDSGDDEGNIIELQLSHKGQEDKVPRSVKILQYESWPDLGCPSSSLDVVHLSRIVDELRQEQDNDDAPTVVHCSAGCGRSGTFCTVDSVINMISSDKVEELKKSSGGHDDHVEDKLKISQYYKLESNQVEELFNQDIIGMAVEELRLQRMSMVQTLRQFITCYENVAAWMLLNGQ